MDARTCSQPGTGARGSPPCFRPWRSCAPPGVILSPRWLPTDARSCFTRFHGIAHVSRAGRVWYLRFVPVGPTVGPSTTLPAHVARDPGENACAASPHGTGDSLAQAAGAAPAGTGW